MKICKTRVTLAIEFILQSYFDHIRTSALNEQKANRPDKIFEDIENSLALHSSATIIRVSSETTINSMKDGNSSCFYKIYLIIENAKTELTKLIEIHEDSIPKTLSSFDKINKQIKKIAKKIEPPITQIIEANASLFN